jgi:hypothetical protein
MAQLMDLITQAIGGDTTQQIGRQLGADHQTTQTAIAAALPLLMTALARNTASSDGADALHAAVSRDHDGSILDNLSGFLGNAQSGPGAGILNHLLGEHQPVAQQAVSKASGLDTARTSMLLMTLAPVVMGAIGKFQRQNNLDASGLASTLGTERHGLTQTSPDLMSMASQLLEKGGGSSVLDEIGAVAGKLFGGR